MTQSINHNAGNSEAQQKLSMSFLFAQDAPGLATDGALTGLGVAQTATASASVVIAKGAGVVQDTVLAGAQMLTLDSDLTLDVLTSNPMGGVPRNDLVVFDSATIAGGTGGLRVIVGTPNASPTDPSYPATALRLARMRHAASATKVPTSKIDNLAPATTLFGVPTITSSTVNGTPFASTSAAKAGKRMHWGTATSIDVQRSDATGIQSGISHGAGFTPQAMVISPMALGLQFRVFNFTSTTFDIQVLNSDGSANGTSTFTYSYFCGE